TTSSQALWMAIIVYYTSLGFVKVSIIVQYLRIFVDKRMRITCWVLLVAVTLYSLTTIFCAAFTCYPVHFFWDTDAAGSHTCLDQKSLWFANASLNIVTDMLVLICPMPALSHLQLPKRQKIGVMLVFAIGGVTVIMSILRLHSLYVISVSKDVSWDNVGASTWSMVELNTGITCACLPMLKSLIARLFPRLLGSSRHTSAGDPERNGAYARQTSKNPRTLNNSFCMTDGVCNKICGVGPGDEKGKEGYRNDIQVTTVVEVSRQGAGYLVVKGRRGGTSANTSEQDLLGITVIPPCSVHIPIMRSPLCLGSLHIRIPLDDRRDAASLGDIATQCKRLVGAAAADIPRFGPVVVGELFGGAGAACTHAAGEEDAEEWAQGRGCGGDDSDADFDGGPDCDVHSGVEEVVDVGHAADEGDADDRCGGGTGDGLGLIFDCGDRGVGKGGCLHATDGENGGDGELGAEIHLQIPDHEGGEDAEDPVSHAGDGGVGVERIDGNLGVDAGALSTGVLGPEVCRGATLQDEDPDDDFVGPDDSDAEQENTNAQLERHSGQDVDWFARPPPLRMSLWNISRMLAGPIMDARNSKSAVQYEENLHRKLIAIVPNATNKPTVARSSGPRPAGVIAMMDREKGRKIQLRSV
ncbi:hypothetical protein V501_01188, partial [Pseudogymnoascus sp. VKM F-4519 (FW-2642)]